MDSKEVHFLQIYDSQRTLGSTFAVNHIESLALSWELYALPYAPMEGIKWPSLLPALPGAKRKG